MKDVRKNIRDLTNNEKQNYIQAVKALKAKISPITGRSIYDEYVLWHSLATQNADPTDPIGFRNSAHAGPAFTAWHRYYLYRFEKQLQKVVPGLTIPYWDWTEDTNDPFNSPLWAADFMGGNGDPQDNNVVKTGPFAVDLWTTINIDGTTKGGLQRQFGQLTSGIPSQADVNLAIGETPYDSSPWNFESSPSHRNRLEGFLAPDGSFAQLHNQAHVWVGGDMVNVNISPNDPVFFIHHCNVDRVWAIWQDKNPTQGYLPTGEGPSGHNLYDLMYPWNGKATKLKAKPVDVLNYKKLGYTYV
ncbi:tyrosinase [Nostoc sp. NIES-4103]|nr:tyrosinase [Nostoc sp. NIES-4103]